MELKKLREEHADGINTTIQDMNEKILNMNQKFEQVNLDQKKVLISKEVYTQTESETQKGFDGVNDLEQLVKQSLQKHLE